MCNAHNHPENCDCGWGENKGIHFKFSGQIRLFQHSHWPKGIPPILPNLFSTLTPNARCPVCREPVFYYCNEHGSSVFFDQLGIPWPKHPCTDSKFLVPLVLKQISGEKIEQPSNGWKCFKIINFEALNEKAYKLKILISEKIEQQLFVPVNNLTVKSQPALLSEDSIGFIKKIGKSTYTISILSDQLTIIESNAYENEKDITK